MWLDKWYAWSQKGVGGYYGHVQVWWLIQSIELYHLWSWNGTNEYGYDYIPELYDRTYLDFKNKDLKHTLDKIKEEAKEKETKYITINEARTIVPASYSTYLDWLKAGKIKGKKHGKAWFILRKSLDTLEN